MQHFNTKNYFVHFYFSKKLFVKIKLLDHIAFRKQQVIKKKKIHIELIIRHV